MLPKLSPRLLIGSPKILPAALIIVGLLLLHLAPGPATSGVPLVAGHVLVLLVRVGSGPRLVHTSLELRGTGTAKALLVIVLLPLHRVTQHLVSLMDHIELVLGGLIVRIRVRMVLLGHSKVLGFDFLIRGCRGDAQELIVVRLPLQKNKRRSKVTPLLQLLP